MRSIPLTNRFRSESLCFSCLIRLAHILHIVCTCNHINSEAIDNVLDLGSIAPQIYQKHQPRLDRDFSNAICSSKEPCQAKLADCEGRLESSGHIATGEPKLILGRRSKPVLHIPNGCEQNDIKRLGSYRRTSSINPFMLLLANNLTSNRNGRNNMEGKN